MLRSLRELEATLVRVERLAALQRLYAETVPRDLADKSQVACERTGAVVVVAETGAIAHKLKQLVPRVVEKFVKFAPEVTSIHVEVQVKSSRDLHPRARPVISPSGLSRLRGLRDALPDDSQLRDALSRMIRHAARSDGEDHGRSENEQQKGRAKPR